MASERIEHLSKVILVFFFRIRINNDVVEIHDNEFSKEISKSVVHYSLKCRRCICETEGHREEFVLSRPCIKSRFRYRSFTDFDLIISRCEIDFRETLSGSYRVEAVLNSR